MKEQKRIEWIDVIRSLAICCVVMCHSAEGQVYHLNAEFMNGISLGSKLFAISMYSIGRIGVPLFLMITGYLLLDREYSGEKTVAFWKNKCLPLFLVTESWILLYNLFFYPYDGITVTVGSVLREMMLVNGFAINHMWYMPVILGLYLMLPLMANGLKSIETKIILIPYILFVLLFMGIPTLNMILAIGGRGLGQTVVSQGFSGGVYGLYLITGYLLKKGVLHEVKSSILCFAAGISFVCAVVLQLCLYKNGVTYAFFYENILLLIIGGAIFELISRETKMSVKSGVRVVSYYSFAIYLIHKPIAIMTKNILLDVMELRPLIVILTWIITMTGSLLLAYFISRIPKVGNKLLYLK